MRTTSRRSLRGCSGGATRASRGRRGTGCAGAVRAGRRRRRCQYTRPWAAGRPRPRRVCGRRRRPTPSPRRGRRRSRAAGPGGCSPRVRGWPLGLWDRELDGILLPARAGMVPSPCSRTSPWTAAPRTRRDVPTRRGARPARLRICSLGVRLLPVPAGMVPAAGPVVRLQIVAPCTPGAPPRPWSRGPALRVRCPPRR